MQTFFFCVMSLCISFLNASNPKVESPKPLPIPVVTLEIIEDYIPHGEEPYVDHKMRPTPSQKVREWLETKLKANGKEGSAVIRIQEASMRWQKAPGKMQSSGYWPYRGILRVQIELRDRYGKNIGTLNSEVTRVREVNENFFGGNKQEAWAQMLEMLLQDLDAYMRRNLALHGSKTSKKSVVAPARPSKKIPEPKPKPKIKNKKSKKEKKLKKETDDQNPKKKEKSKKKKSKKKKNKDSKPSLRSAHDDSSTPIQTKLSSKNHR